VAYHVELHEQTVVPFLEDTACVSPTVREVLERNLEEHLGQHGDFFCLQECYRIHGTSLFRFGIVLADPDTGRIRHFRFTVSDAAAAYGVLQVLLIEEVA
jgi:hypothetical protein